MVRTVDYDARRRAVLGVAINRYIKDAAPVSSEDIAREFDLSPATIRNIFVDLEKSGYLTHPHTSAGRVPTDKGYRQYVDFLSSQLELLDGEKKSIVKHFEKEISRLEDALEETSEVISAITHYTSIVSFLDWQERLFYRGMNFILEQPEFQDLHRIGLIIKMIEERQGLLDIINRDFKEKVRVYIGEELGCAQMSNCSMVVTTYSVKNKPLGRLAILGPRRMEYQHIIPALEYVSDVLSRVLSKI